MERIVKKLTPVNPPFAPSPEKRKILAIKNEIFSRIVGYYRPIESYNPGKRQEFNDRHVFSPEELTSSALIESPELECESKAV